MTVSPLHPAALPIAQRRGRARPRAAELDRAIQSFFQALFQTTENREAERDADVVREVEAAQRGDAAASQRIYRRWMPMVFRTVRPMCRGEADAEDVVQDTFVQALSNLSQYRSMPGARFQSWLIAIALNAARKRSRWHRRIVDSDVEPEAATEGEGPDEQLERARNKRAFLKVLAELPEREREIVALRYGSELSWAEVANSVNLGEANVRKIGERLRGKLVSRVQEVLAGEAVSQPKGR